jgi:hypothetical protein
MFSGYNYSMNIPLPPIYLSIAALTAGVLGLAAFSKLGRLTRTSILTVTRIGVVFVGPAIFLFGLIYLYFVTHPEITPQIYAPYIRWPLLYLLCSINAWFIVTLTFGREL